MSDPRPVANANPLARQLFARAHELGISDRQIGLRSGYGPTLVYQWRHRRYRRDRLQVLIDFAAVLGLEITLTETKKD